MDSAPYSLHWPRLPRRLFPRIRLRSFGGSRYTGFLRHTWLKASAGEKAALLGSLLLLVLPLAGAAILSLGYLLAIIGAAIAGHALPAATPLTAITCLAGIAPKLTAPHLVDAAMSWAAACMLWTWLSFSARTALNAVRRPVLTLAARLAARWGLVCILAMLLLQIGLAWAGHQIGYFDIYGLYSFSDASGYWAGMLQGQETGVWSSFIARMPVAAAMRTLVGTGVTYYGMLVVQTCLLGLAAWLACRAVSKSWGIWSGICFFLLCLRVSTPFNTSAATETLGLAVALLAIPLITHGMRTRSLPLLLAAIAILWLALLSRMGAMFLPLTLGIWVLLLARRQRKNFLVCLMSLCCIMAGGLLYAAAVQKLYAPPNQTTGSNFAHTLYGLSVNKDWSAAYRDFETELPRFKNEKEAAAFLIDRAKENITDQPILLFRALRSNVWHGTAKLFKMSILNIVEGYGRSLKLVEYLLLGMMLLGTVAALKTGALKAKVIFSFFTVLGLIASAAIVYRSSGERILITGYPFLWLCYCSFLALPGPPRRTAFSAAVGREDYAAAFIAVLLIAGTLIIPAVGSKASIPFPPPGHLYLQSGFRTSPGVFVAEDGAPLPRDIPSIHFSALTDGYAKRFGELIPTSLWPAPPFTYTAAFYKQSSSMAAAFFFMPSPDFLRFPAEQTWDIQIQSWAKSTAEIDNQLGTHIEVLSLVPVSP